MVAVVADVDVGASTASWAWTPSKPPPSTNRIAVAAGEARRRAALKFVMIDAMMRAISDNECYQCIDTITFNISKQQHRHSAFIVQLCLISDLGPTLGGVDVRRHADVG